MDNQKKFNIELDIVKRPHVKNDLYFYKYFKQAPKFNYEVYDLHKSVRVEMNELLNNSFSLDLVFKKEYFTESDTNPVSPYDIITTAVDDIHVVHVDIAKKVLLVRGDDSLSILSLVEIDDKLKNEIETIVKKGIDSKKSNSVHILTFSTDEGMYLTDFKIDDKYLDLDLEKNYNEGFKEVHDEVIDKLKSNNLGLYLFHGNPGTGKTTYIRHLIRKISKRVIFVSPSMSEKISDPDMIPFLMRYPDSVLVIEDGENIIKQRGVDGGQSVSNLLNLSDGILGDCLKFQIICTFNTDKNSIDTALLRKGRLLKSYNFEELSLDKTNTLLKELGYDKSKEPLSLADIYNMEEDNSYDDGKPIGF